ncbi:MAG: histidinol-phosphate transaminase [Bdellovibrionales bacterium]|nr:histidinol-phosphate transaminase [Bdellovibrionales bacterium]
MKALPEIQSLHPYQPGKPISETKRELGLKHVYKLASNESPLGTSPMVRDAVIAAVDEINRYPDGACFEMRQAVAAYYGVPPQNLMFGNGSDEIVDILVQIYCDPAKDSILTSQGAFSAYQISAQSVRVRAQTTALTSDLRFDLKAMAALIEKDPSIRFVFLPNPNNPTGTYFTAEEFDAFMAVASRKDLFVVLDEAYVEFVRAKDFPRGQDYQKKYPNILLLRTMSKVFGLAALRIGVLIAPPEVCDMFNRVRKPFNINSLAQVAVVASLRDKEHLEKIKQVTWDGLDYYHAQLDKMGVKYWPSQANFVLFDCGRDAGEVFQELLREGVILRPVKPYGMPNYLRMSVGLQEENEAAIRALQKVLR